MPLCRSVQQHGPYLQLFCQNAMDSLNSALGKVHKPPGRCFTNATNSTIYEALPELPDGVSTVSEIAMKELKPEHFGASPDEVPGWASMSKKALKKAMLDLRWDKLRSEKDRRKLEAAAAAASSTDNSAPPAAKRRKLDDGCDDSQAIDAASPLLAPSAAGDFAGGGTAASSTAPAAPLAQPLPKEWLEAASRGVRVVVDCSFDHLMTSGELSSMRSQLALGITANEKRSGGKPLRLIITSLSDSQLLQMAGRGVAGLHTRDLVARWGVDVFSQHFTEVFNAAGKDGDSKPAAENKDAAAASDVAGAVDFPDARERLPALTAEYLAKLKHAQASSSSSSSSSSSTEASSEAASDVKADSIPSDHGLPFGRTLPTPLSAYDPPVTDPRSQLVYLTADSSTVLPPSSSLDRSKVYIVGGVVDRNRHKGMTLQLAKQYGIATARFPIVECGISMAGSTVLTTNHVVEILARVSASDGDWKGPLEAVIPQRKGKGIAAGAGPAWKPKGSSNAAAGKPEASEAEAEQGSSAAEAEASNS